MPDLTAKARSKLASRDFAPDIKVGGNNNGKRNGSRGK